MYIGSSSLSPDKIKHLRKEKGWSQDLLAKASGLSLRTIQRVEKDGTSSAETQLALASALDVSPKSLFPISHTPDVQWKWRNLMQNSFAIIVLLGAVYMLINLGLEISAFIDIYVIGFLIMFTYGCTVVAFGASGLANSFTGLRYIFANQVTASPATAFLAVILKQQIYFLYGGAVIALCVGSISIHSTSEATSNSDIFHKAYAVNILVIFYAAFIAETFFRPLAAKLTNAELSAQFR